MALDSTMELLHALAVTDSSNDMYRKRVITNASKDFTKKKNNLISRKKKINFTEKKIRIEF